MTRLWLGYTTESTHQEVRDALATYSPSGRVSFTRSASELRARLRDEEPGCVGAVVGMCEHDVSDINLAAALVADGLADEVVLVARGATGSLRSRAACAGIARVIDLADASTSVRGASETHIGGGDRPRTVVPRTGREDDGRREVGDPPSRAPIVTFVSGRGGVGKSTLAAVTAAAAGRWGLRVALCDLDLASGNLHEYCGLRQGCDLARLAAGGRLARRDVASAGMPCGENVTLWGPCARPEAAEVVASVVGELLDELAIESDVVLVDTSTACTDGVAQAMQLADRLVVVHGRESFGLSSAARTSALAVRLGVARTRIVRIENGCAPRDLGQPFMPRAEVGLETARAFRIVWGGEEVGERLRTGDAAGLSELSAGFSETVLVFLSQLLAELGCLPACEEAQRLAKGVRHTRVLPFFGRLREAV